MNEKYRLIAPDIDKLLGYFRERHLNPSIPSARAAAAIEPLFNALSMLKPVEKNEEVKAIWLAIPSGTIIDFDSFEYLKECELVETYEEYEALWREHYPDPLSWYRLLLFESKNREGNVNYRGIVLGESMLISADMDKGFSEEERYDDEELDMLCKLLTEAAEEAIGKIRKGTYYDELNALLPYKFKTGVVKRSVVWKHIPEWKAHAFEDIDEDTINAFKELLNSGRNDEMKIGRLDSMTANDFFRACSIGYKACGYDFGGLSLVDLYFKYADGRDEGLTGRGYGLNKGDGIDFDDPAAWEKWYFDCNRHGGHPWEVIRGGNSTHVDLFVRHDRQEIDWMVRAGKLTEEEAAKHPNGFYYTVAGKHCPGEAVHFYVALSQAGLPVILHDAKEILARFEATDYVGIVPHFVTPKYCEDMFPAKYGRVIDFFHVYKEEMELFGNEIEWLPLDNAELIC